MLSQLKSQTDQDFETSRYGYRPQQQQQPGISAPQLVPSTNPSLQLSLTAPSLFQGPTGNEGNVPNPSGAKGNTTVGAAGQQARMQQDVESGSIQRGAKPKQRAQPQQQPGTPPSGGAQDQVAQSPADPAALLAYRNSLPPGARYYFDKSLESQEQARHARLEHTRIMEAKQHRAERLGEMATKAPSLLKKPTTQPQGNGGPAPSKRGDFMYGEE